MADWDGHAYRQVSDLQQWLAAESLSGLTIEGCEQVLDVGCGDGRITAAIADRLGQNGSIVGIDPSPRMIEAAEGLPGAACSNLRFEVGDVLGMAFEDEFDLLVSFNALHWVPDQGEALRRIRAALRETGSALLQFVCGGERPSLEEVAMQVCSAPTWRANFAGFAAPFVHVHPDRYIATAGALGLQVCELDVKDMHWDFESRQAFARWCRVGFDAWTAQIDRSAADAFVADVIDSYSKVTGSSHDFNFLQMRVQLEPRR